MYACDQAINKFESMVNQIKKNAEDIEQRLEMIRQMNLFKPCPLNLLGELPRCKVTQNSFKSSRVTFNIPTSDDRTSVK